MYVQGIIYPCHYSGPALQPFQSKPLPPFGVLPFTDPDLLVGFAGVFLLFAVVSAGPRLERFGTDAGAETRRPDAGFAGADFTSDSGGFGFGDTASRDTGSVVCFFAFAAPGA